MVDDRRQDALAHAVLVPRSAARGSEHELVGACGFALGAPRVHLLNDVEAQVDLADAGGRLGPLDY